MDGGPREGSMETKKVKKKSSPLLSLSLSPRLGFSASERSFLSLCSTPPAPSLCAPSFTLPPSRSPHAVHHVDSFARAARRSLLLERQDGLQQGIIDDAASADGSSFPSRRRSRAASSRPGQGLAEVLCLRSRFRAPRRGELSCRMRLFCDVGGRKREGEAKRRFRLSLFFAGGVLSRSMPLARSLAGLQLSSLSFPLCALFFARPASAVSSIENAKERHGREAERGGATSRGKNTITGRRRSATFSRCCRTAWCPLVSISCPSPRAFPPPAAPVQPRSARARAATRRIPASEPVLGARTAQAEARGSSR